MARKEVEKKEETGLTISTSNGEVHDLSGLFTPTDDHKEARTQILETAVKELFSSDKFMKGKTRLRDEEVMTYAAGFVFQQVYRSNAMKVLLENLMELKVSSQGGAGRREFVDMVRASAMGPDMEGTRERSWIRRLLRR